MRDVVDGTKEMIATSDSEKRDEKTHDQDVAANGGRWNALERSADHDR